MTPRRPLPPLASLRAFEAAARHLSFQKAAEELSVTPAAVSHQIRLLEETLGLSLFERHIRRVSLTHAGRILFPPLRDGFDMFAETLETLRFSQERRAVTLSAPTLFTARCLIPTLGQFRQDHPEFDLRLHASEAVVDLHAGVADAAVRYGPGPFPNLVSHHLYNDCFGVVCSPRLDIEKMEDLKSATLLHAEWYRSERTSDWSQWATVAGASWLDVETGPRFTNDSHAIQAAVAGHGVAIASLVLLHDELSSGVLVQPFGPLIEGDGYHFLTTHKNMARAEILAVREWLTTQQP